MIILDLPEDAHVLEVDKIINLDTSQLKTEETGEKIVTKLQQWLLTKTEPDQRAVLPEDKIQRLLVGVSRIILQIYFL